MGRITFHSAIIIVFLLTVHIFFMSCSDSNEEPDRLIVGLLDGKAGELLLEIEYENIPDVKIIAMGHNSYEVYENKELIMKVELQKVGFHYEVIGMSVNEVELKSKSLTWEFVSLNKHPPFIIRKK